MPLAAIHQRGDQQFGAVLDALDLEPQELGGPLAQRHGRALALLAHQIGNGLTPCRTGDANETPRLHQANAGCLMRSVEQFRQQLRCYLAAREMAHVTALGNGAVDRGALSALKACALMA